MPLQYCLSLSPTLRSNLLLVFFNTVIDWTHSEEEISTAIGVQPPINCAAAVYGLGGIHFSGRTWQLKQSSRSMAGSVSNRSGVSVCLLTHARQHHYSYAAVT